MTSRPLVSFLALVACAAPVPPSPPDSGPVVRGPPTLAMALAGIEGEGDLFFEITTSTGSFSGRLFEARAPISVANFVGLSRGLAPWQEPETGRWVTRPFYDGLPFHRTSPGEFIQTGDPVGNGLGGPGYFFSEAGTSSVSRAGDLSMARDGDLAGSQVVITERPLPEPALVFGRLVGGLDVIRRISRSARNGDRPIAPVVIESVAIFRARKSR